MSEDNTKDHSIYPVVINVPLAWNQMQLSQAVKSIRFTKDENGNIWGTPTVIMDTTGGTARPMTEVSTDGIGAANGGLNTNARNYLYNPSLAIPGWDMQRTPTIFKTVQITAVADNVVWTPATGKRFRLLGYNISWNLGTIAAAAGLETITFKDGAAGTAFSTHAVQISNASAYGYGSFDVNYPGNGFLSGLADRVLAVALDRAITAGGFWINVWGTEEY